MLGRKKGNVSVDDTGGGLRRNLALWQVVGLSISDIGPTMTVLFLSTGVFPIAGTFTLGANLLIGFTVIMIAMCLGELASAFPRAGGSYSLVRGVLPRPFAWVTLFNFLIQGMVIPAALALGVAQFLQDLIPSASSIPATLIAALALLLAFTISATKVELGADTTVWMISIELLVLAIVTVAALLHPHQSLLSVTFHPVLLNGHTLALVGGAALLATIAPAFNMINGYDSTLGFSEELKGDSSRIAKGVIMSAAMGAVLIIVPLAAAIVAAPNLTGFLSAASPPLYSVHAALGSTAADIVDIGVAISLFNSMVVLFMYFGRVLYTTGRDGLWGTQTSTWLSGLNRLKVPARAVGVLLVVNGILIFMSALNWLIIFSGTVTAATYLMVGIAALASWGKRRSNRPWRMPLYPFPAVVVVVVTGVALLTQGKVYLIDEVVLCAGALLAWAILERGKSSETAVELSSPLTTIGGNIIATDIPE